MRNSVALAVVVVVVACAGTAGKTTLPDSEADDTDSDPFTDAAGFEPTSFGVEVSGSGRPVIFIPGLGCPGEVWNDTVAHLGDEVESHVLTLSGFAGRPRIKKPLSEAVRHDLARYIRSRHLDHPIIVGHSMGGLIAYWLAEYHPDMVGGAIIVDAGPALSDTDPVTGKQLRDQWAHATDEQFAAQARVVFTGMTSDPKRLEPIIAAVAKSDRRAMGDAIYELVTTDLRERVHNIRAPVLVVLADGGLQQQITAQVEPIPHHEVVVLPRTHHFVMYDDPVGFYRLVDKFLAKHPPPER